MLDFDLARIYGYETKRFNEQIKNNSDKFEEDFMFRLTSEEWSAILKSKKSASSWGRRRKLPLAFTEQVYVSTQRLVPAYAMGYNVRKSE